MADVQQRERNFAFDRRRFVRLQRLIKAPRLVVFIAEILDRFVVQQRVDGFGVGLSVHLVHVPAVFQPPLGYRHGPKDVNAHGDKGDQGKPDIEQAPHHRADQKDFQERRDHVE